MPILLPKPMFHLPNRCLLIVFMIKYIYLLNLINPEVNCTSTQSELQNDQVSNRNLQTIPIQKYQQPAFYFPPSFPPAPPGQINLKEQSANLPLGSSRQDEYDRFLRLKNLVKDTTDQQLASINNRALPNHPSNEHLSKSKSTDKQAPESLEMRSDLLTVKKFDQVEPTLYKKGHVEDVQLLHYDQSKQKLKPHQPTRSAHHFPDQYYGATNPFIKSGLFMDKLQTNCIKRSESKVAVCEDHLIRRLNQDAREGRTAFDVGRRVCCALFWHRDCVARMMLETCPDSSPAAADELMGPRKLDLTLSCQKFNRDGCNAADTLKADYAQLGWKFIIIFLSIIIQLVINFKY